MELTTSNVFLAFLTIVIASVGYIVLFGPNKKDREKVLEEMKFDMDDEGWAEEEKTAVEDKPKVMPKGGMPPVPTGGANPTPGPESIPDVKPRSHDPSLPFQIGDRVILQNLVGAAMLNGRHGVIAAPFDKKTERYAVDLDLPHDKPCAVKEANLKKEPAFGEPPADQPKVSNAVMEPAHAKACGFILHVLRKSCSQTLNGETNPYKLSVFGWKFWEQSQGSTGVYPSLLKYLTKDILATQKLTDLDKQLSPDPNNPTSGAYQLVTKAMKSPLAVAGWKVRVEGAFWIVGMGPTGTMVIPCNNIRQVYVVAGYQAPLMAVAGGGANRFPRPPKFHLTLLPWFGRIVHDSFLCTTTGSNQVELATPQLAQELIASSKLAVAENRLVTSLNQLRMDPPNFTGVPYIPPPVPTTPPQDPPSDEEKELVQKIATITNLIPPPDGLWNFIQPPTPSATGGANQYVVLNAKGEKFAEFNGSHDEAYKKHLDILKQVGIMCEERSKRERPAAIGVDNNKVCARLQFLCKDVPDMRILLLNVNVKQQQQQANKNSSEGTKEETKVAAAE